MNEGSVLLLSALALGELLDVSRRHIYRLKSAGKLPRPVRVGASLRWRKEHINQWIEWGCPEQKIFEAKWEGRK